MAENRLNKSNSTTLVFILVLLFSLFLYLKLTSGGAADHFDMVGYFKVRNALGANVRVFSFYTTENDSSKIQEHAKRRPYTKGGSTTVFYFNSRENTPDVTFVREQFDNRYEPYCIAAYWRFPNGTDKFQEKPFE